MKTTPTLQIIAIGSSAGGLEALQDFLLHLPSMENTCIIIAQHLSPTHKSMLVHLLGKGTQLDVLEAKHNAHLEADKVYITPPDSEIWVEDITLKLRKPQNAIGPKPSVNVLFNSLANIDDRKVVGVILSGTGSDGADGIQALSNANKYTIVQQPENAKYDGMPLSAIQTGLVDKVLPAEKIGEEILKYFNSETEEQSNETELSNSEYSAVNEIIKLLSKSSGTDFSNYKFATINRRLKKRMLFLEIKSFEAYLKFLNENPEESEKMYKTFLIGITTFFRDKETFKVLENYLANIVESKNDGDSIRVWVPGCSTGEEPYSIAILLHRLLGEKSRQVKVQIFATDIDEKAITNGRKGLYTKTSLEHIPEKIRKEYFIKKGKKYELIKPVRSMLLFSKHDILKNPPFLKLDLVSCRNLLIYFNTVLQQQVLPMFHYSLNMDGYLLLGKSETIGKFTDLFSPLDASNKLFQRKQAGNIHRIRFSTFNTKRKVKEEKREIEKEPKGLSEIVKETLYKTYEHPYVIVNESHDIQEVNGDVRLFLSLKPGSIHVNLIKMANEELQIELRAVLSKAIKEHSGVKSKIKRFKLFGQWHFVRFDVKPLVYSGNSKNLFMVIFEKLDLDSIVSSDNTEKSKNLKSSRIKELEHELNVTKEELQNYIEEIETSNEELQSLNEEAQSANEELQSANEELETSNQELQSANEEIQIAYTELRAVNEELEKKDRLIIKTQANTQALLNNELQAFVLTDTSYKILRYNNKAIETFSDIKGKEIQLGDSVIDLLPSGQVEAFVQDFKIAVKGKIYQGEREFVDENGRKRWFSLNYSPVSYSDGEVSGISIGLLEITTLKNAMLELEVSEKLINSVFNTVTTGICITDEKGTFIDLNERLCKIFGKNKSELIGENFTDISSAEQNQVLQDLHQKLLNSEFEEKITQELLNAKGETIIIEASAELLHRPDEKTLLIIAIREVTKEKIAQKELNKALDELKESKAILSQTLNSSPDIICTVDRDGVFKEINDAVIRFWGYTPEELVGKVCQDFMVEEDKGKSSLAGDEIIQGAEVNNFENRYLRKDGSVIPMIWSAKWDSETETMYCVGKDATSIKKGEEKLRKSEEKYRSLFNLSPMPMLIFDLETLKILDVNETAVKQYGYSKKEFLSKKLLDIRPKDAVPKLLDEVKAFFESKATGGFGVHTHQKKDGTLIKVEVTGHKLFYEGKNSAIVLYNDVTERESTLNALRESESRYRGFYDSQTNYVVRTDMNGDYTYYNKKFEEEFAWIYPDGIILGKNCMPSISEHHHEKVTQVVEKCLAEPEKVFKVEIDKPSKSGGIVTTLWDFVCIKDAKGNPREIQCMGIDITDRKELEYLLERANQMTRTGSWELSLKDNKPKKMFWSDIVKDILEVEKEYDPTLNKWLGFFEKASRKKMKSAIELLISNREKFDFELLVNTAKGQAKWVRCIGECEMDEEECIKILGSFQDIDNRKRTEIELNNKTLELSHSNQELEQFAYVASHDLQEPLRMVTNFLTQLEKKYGDKLDDKAQRYIDFAVDGSRRMRQIILDLLEFSRVGKYEGELESIDMNDLVNDVLSLLRKSIAEKKAKIKFENLPEIKMYRAPLNQIFQNLISNALKYTDKGKAPKITIEYKELKDKWHFSVKDNGIGMEKENLEKIFIIFARLHDKETYDGTGLGLAIVKKIIEKLGGEIWAESELGKGSTFHFTLKKF